MRFLTKYSCVYYVYIVFFVLSALLVLLTAVCSPFFDILYAPTASCYVAPSARRRACLSVATIWRYVKLLCDHICSHIGIPEIAVVSRYGR